MTFETSDTDEPWTDHVDAVENDGAFVRATCPGCGHGGWINVEAVKAHTGTTGICGNCSTEFPILK